MNIYTRDEQTGRRSRHPTGDVRSTKAEVLRCFPKRRPDSILQPEPTISPTRIPVKGGIRKATDQHLSATENLLTGGLSGCSSDLNVEFSNWSPSPVGMEACGEVDVCNITRSIDWVPYQLIK